MLATLIKVGFNGILLAPRITVSSWRRGKTWLRYSYSSCTTTLTQLRMPCNHLCSTVFQFISPSLALSSPALFSRFFRGDLERERDLRDFRLSFSDSLECDRVRFGDLSSFVDSSSSSGSICSLSGFSTLGFFSSFFPSLSKIWSSDLGICARWEMGKQQTNILLDTY